MSITHDGQDAMTTQTHHCYVLDTGKAEYVSIPLLHDVDAACSHAKSWIQQSDSSACGSNAALTLPSIMRLGA